MYCRNATHTVQSQLKLGSACNAGADTEETRYPRLIDALFPDILAWTTFSDPVVLSHIRCT